MKRSNSGLQKTTEIIKILDIFNNADISKNLVEFQCFDKKITQSMFPPPKKNKQQQQTNKQTNKHQSKPNINVRKQQK